MMSEKIPFIASLKKIFTCDTFWHEVREILEPNKFDINLVPSIFTINDIAKNYSSLFGVKLHKDLLQKSFFFA